MKDPELIAIRDQEVLNYRTRQELKHNPQETIDTAFELMQQFPDIKLEIVSDVNAIPGRIRYFGIARISLRVG